MKKTICSECWGSNGNHYRHCATRGYSAVGPHPDAPPVESAPSAPAPAEIEMCCGGTCVRAACAYHGPSTAPTQQPEYAWATDLVDQTLADLEAQGLLSSFAVEVTGGDPHLCTLQIRVTLIEGICFEGGIEL